MFNFFKCSQFVNETRSIQNALIKRYKFSLSSDVKSTSKFDVVIVGAGCMGSLIAFWLKKKAGSALSILVIDRDLTVLKFLISFYIDCVRPTREFSMYINLSYLLYT